MTISHSALFRLWRRNERKLDRPIFILGCRRSGTTILGRTIGAHRGIAYVNGPREIWNKGFPQSDIWTTTAVPPGRIVLDENDWTQEGAATVRDAFSRAVRAGTRLCEKTPINAFRAPLINRIFPDCLFVYIEREALAVAESVAVNGRFTYDPAASPSRWQQISTLAEQRPVLKGLAATCETPIQQALLEWILSTSSAKRFLFGGAVSASRVLRIGYEDFTDDPAGTLAEFESFAGLPHDTDAAAKAVKTLRPARRAKPHDDDPVIAALLNAASLIPQSQPV